MVANLYRHKLQEMGYTGCRVEPDVDWVNDTEAVLRHVLMLCHEIRLDAGCLAFTADPVHAFKVGTWLGACQGILLTKGVLTLQDFEEITKLVDAKYP
jgi:hypothetical protein